MEAKKRTEQRAQRRREEEERREKKRQELEIKQKEAEERRQKILARKKVGGTAKLRQQEVTCAHDAQVSTECTLWTCGHKKAYKWIECEKCTGWYHCICVRMPTKSAVHFTCNVCK